MPTTKKLATWIWTQLKSEMRFQKAPPVRMMPQRVHYVIQAPAKSTKGIDALRGVLIIIIAPIIFVILALMIGL